MGSLGGGSRTALPPHIEGGVGPPPHLETDGGLKDIQFVDGQRAGCQAKNCWKILGFSLK